MNNKYEEYNSTLEGAGYDEALDKRDNDAWKKTIERGILKNNNLDDDG